MKITQYPVKQKNNNNTNHPNLDNVLQKKFTLPIFSLIAILMTSLTYFCFLSNKIVIRIVFKHCILYYSTRKRKN